MTDASLSNNQQKYSVTHLMIANMASRSCTRDLRASRLCCSSHCASLAWTGKLATAFQHLLGALCQQYGKGKQAISEALWCVNSPRCQARRLASHPLQDDAAANLRPTLSTGGKFQLTAVQRPGSHLSKAAAASCSTLGHGCAWLPLPYRVLTAPVKARHAGAALMASPVGRLSHRSCSTTPARDKLLSLLL